jgi:hypothetical protein
MSEEQALKIIFKVIPKNEALKNDDDINKFIEKQISEVIPLDRPAWDYWYQEEYGNDGKYSL